MGERGTKRGGLITGEEPKRAEKPVKKAAERYGGYEALRQPQKIRQLLQEIAVQRFREKHDDTAVPLARNLFGLVFEDGHGQFWNLPATDRFDIRSETALVTAWLAAQVKDAQLFRLALDQIRAQLKFDHNLTLIYQGHMECIGAEKFGRRVENAAPFTFEPEKVYGLLSGPFAGLKPLPNVVRAITVRHVKSQADTADSLDATVPGSNKTYFRWLLELRDEALEKGLCDDDGFFVGSVVLLESLNFSLTSAVRRNDMSEAMRCYDRCFRVYTELMLQSRKGTPRLFMSPNAQSLLDQADDIMARTVKFMKTIDR